MIMLESSKGGGRNSVLPTLVAPLGIRLDFFFFFPFFYLISLFNDWVPAAWEAELVCLIAGTLNKVSIL